MGKIDAPVGEVYQAVEGANGELGYYLIKVMEVEALTDCILDDLVLFIIRPILKWFKVNICQMLLFVMSSLNVIAGELDA